MRRHIVLVLVAFGAAAGVLMLTIGAAASPPTGAADGGIAATPVNGEAVGHGLKLWVHVFYAKGGGGGGGGSVNCMDTNTQTGYATPFAKAGAITLAANPTTFPTSLTATKIENALSLSALTWNQAAGSPLLSVTFSGTATAPSRDGTSELGWARLAPKNVLAATWTWMNASNQVVEADLFYNNSWNWDTFASCPSTATGHFDVADIGTHEMGHVLGLNHLSDSGAQATMYPSAPADEIRKTTLTAGDRLALQAAIAGP
jgi:hypothetical protein